MGVELEVVGVGSDVDVDKAVEVLENIGHYTELVAAY